MAQDPLIDAPPGEPTPTHSYLAPPQPLRRGVPIGLRPGPSDRPLAPSALGIVEQPADRRVVAAAIASGAVVDLALRHSGPTLACAVAPMILGAALLATGRLRTRASQICSVIAFAPASLLALRTDAVLGVVATLAAAALLALAASLGREGNVADLSFPQVAQRAALLCGHGMVGLGFAGRAVSGAMGSRRDGARRAARGLAIAVPIVGVLGVLLASGDAVVAGLLGTLSAGRVLGHVALIGVGAALAAGLARAASSSVPPLRRWRHVGRGEARWVLGSVVAALGAFTVVQIVVAVGGARHVLADAGITYADHARSGFFQLLGAAAFVAVVVLTTRAVTDRGGEDRVLAWLGAVASLLTAVIAGSAVARLRLYENAFGLTLLRVWAMAGALMIAGVALVIAARLASAGARPWTTAAVLSVALAGVLALGIVGPVDLVARRNLARAEQGKSLDAGYLVELGPDAIPAIEGALPRISAGIQTDVRSRLCAHSPDGAAGGFLEANLARHRAERSLRRVCATSPR